jgi:hypothetical protein
MSQGHGEELAMDFGDVVAAVGAAELLVLLVVLAVMVISDGPPPRLDVESRAPREEPRKVEEAA